MRTAAAVFVLLAGCLHGQMRDPQSAAERVDPSYVEAMKAELLKAWEPRVKDAACENDPDGTRWSSIDRTTTISYFVDSQGTIVDTRLERSSGAEYLDAVALGAPKGIRVSRPPERLLRENGTAIFAMKFTLLRAPPLAEQKIDGCGPR